ncbi:MAG: PDC sensor domain-containing protein [Deltaproteobacteria bacterium]|nr:PDC sensor domain-containing protein [Deltaproteobacteria bacterium]MBW1993044.1 PDC sensor domain-containing protein [Deltaproteobacteria bacterium]MBW2152731.1 PDC sensor domain-containing protein [Deltaproteobacteria bacterium]
MVSVYRALEKKHPDLIYWQLVGLKNGLQTIYPALKHLPMMYDHLGTNWYRLAEIKKTISWSVPNLDPLTRQMVFTVSAPLHLPDRTFIGATAIVVPVGVLLKEDDHIQGISKNVTSLLIRPELRAETGQLGIRILAREQKLERIHRHWQVSLSKEWLEFEDQEQLLGMIKDLKDRRPTFGSCLTLAMQALWPMGVSMSIIRLC